MKTGFLEVQPANQMNYALYTANGQKEVEFKRITEFKINVYDLKNKYLKGAFKVMTRHELKKFKAAHNLYFDYELGDQLSIFDL